MDSSSRSKLATGHGIFCCKQESVDSLSVKTDERRCAGCAGAASCYPLQSWIFAQLLTVIILPISELAHASAHWALMFFILGLGAGVAYFTLGWSSTTISTVSFLRTVGNSKPIGVSMSLLYWNHEGHTDFRSKSHVRIDSSISKASSTSQLPSSMTRRIPLVR